MNQAQKLPSVNGMAGEGDCSVTFLQRALWLQTGEMIALLS